MKNVKLLALISPLLLLSLTSFLNVVDPIYANFIISSPSYGPYDGTEGTIPVNVSYTYNNSKYYSSVTEYIWVRDATGRVVSRSYGNNHALSKGGNYEVTLNFSPASLRIYSNLTIVFNIYDTTTNDSLYLKNIYLKKMKHITMNPFNDDGKIYTIPECAFCISSTGDAEIDEIFDFSDIEDYFPNEEYYEILLSNQSFNYEFSQDFTYGQAYLTFVDTSNLFPHMAKESDGVTIKIPLALTYSDGVVSYSFANKMYVHPKTLEMSLTSLTGYKTTRRFYLPTGKKDDFEGKKFGITVSEIGANKSTLNYQITYYSSNNLFGYCYNSTYCVKGETK